MSFLVRAAGPGDRAAMLDLWAEAWAETMPSIDFEARRPWFTRYLDDLAAAGTTILLACQDDGTIAGFVTIDAERREIDQLAVAVAFQRRGVATCLIEAAKRLSPGGLCLTVNQANPRAIALYNREGFCVTGTGHSPRSGLPVYVMSWQPDGRRHVSDILFLLRQGFEDPAYPGKLFYCWHCALVEGVLAAFPDRAKNLDVRRIDWRKPRTQVIAMVGEENQSLPLLVLAPGSRSPEETGRHNDLGFIASKDGILAALSGRHGFPHPHP